MDKSSISIDLGDPRTSLVAEALSNKTCVKILTLLAEQELTASDIAQKLSIPLNTVGYNIEKLIAAGLVEKSSNFFWSVKGKKTPVYKVANKKIIISPKRMMKGVIPAIIAIGAVMLLAIAMFFNNSPNAPTNTYTSEQLERFNSYDELVSYLEEANEGSDQYNYFGGAGRGTLQSESAGAPSADMAGAASAADVSGKSENYASDYSKTNVQVEGIDELDIVKNDGKYIYTANQNKVIIVEAYPADSMKIVEELEFENYVTGIFIANEKLIVIESVYGYGGWGYAVPEMAARSSLDKAAAIMPVSPSKPEVKIHIYKTGESVEGVETFATDGNYHSARMVGGTMYLIANRYIDSARPEMPYFRAGEEVETADASRIYYPPISDSGLYFTSVMAIDTDSLEYSGDVFLTGMSSTLYISESAIYITSQKTYDWQKVQEGSLSAMVGAFPASLKSEAESILDSDADQYMKMERLNELLKNHFNELSDSEKKEFEDSIAKAYEDYYSEISKEHEKTSIYKIEIDGLDIEYSGTGEVPGYILNQFSMDERDGYFRIATTTGNTFGGALSSLNHLYVLNEDLEIVGMVEDLAKGETIYSVRFMDNKAYLVTFRQVDPLYVIDLEDPSQPEVLGFLKVTGFSNYLHPIGEDLLLGLGREASEEGRAEGLKISLFDVSDFSNPQELDKYLVEGEWSYSEAEYEHKAVLFSDERDLLVIPVSYYTDTRTGEYWQGAFALGVTDSDISLRGKITHDTKAGKNERDYGYGTAYVQRSLFMDDSLYTISNRMIKANKIEDLAPISSVELPYEEPEYILY